MSVHIHFSLERQPQFFNVCYTEKWVDLVTQITTYAVYEGWWNVENCSKWKIELHQRFTKSWSTIIVDCKMRVTFWPRCITLLWCSSFDFCYQSLLPLWVKYRKALLTLGKVDNDNSYWSPSHYIAQQWCKSWPIHKWIKPFLGRCSSHTSWGSDLLHQQPLLFCALLLIPGHTHFSVHASIVLCRVVDGTMDMTVACLKGLG